MKLDACQFSPSVHAPESESPLSYPVEGADHLDSCTPAERFRHSGWQRTRSLLRSALLRTHQSVSRILNWDNCGFGAYVLQSVADPGRFKIAGSNCHDRFCTPCSRLRSQCIANALVDTIGDRQCRFVTLTLKHRPDSLQDTLDRLYKAFARLRRAKLWRSKVHGGAAFVEVKWSEASGEWHPHLHVLCVGRFLPQPELRRLWFTITGDSYVVDVRLARNVGDVTHYVSKYVTKFVSGSFVNRPACLDEAVRAMHGRKLCLTFGTWRGVLLTADDSSADWVNLGSLNDWVARAVCGDQEAVSLLNALEPGFFADEKMKADSRASPPRLEVRKSDTSQMRFPVELMVSSGLEAMFG